MTVLVSATALLLPLLPTVAFAVPSSEVKASPRSAHLTASQRAAATGEPVEVTSERTEYTTTMANPDGTFVLTQATEPQRARDESGTWRDIDVTLEKRPDGTVGPKSAVVDLAFSGGGSGSGLLTLGAGEQRLKLGWPTSLPEPSLDGATATYADVPVKDVDLQLTATAEGYREVLVVKTAEAAASPELEKVKLTARGEGLSVTPGEGGGLRAVDADGNAVFRGPAGQMWDSAGEAAPAPRKGLRAVAPEGPENREAEDRTRPGRGDTTADLPVTVGDGSVSVTPDLNLLRGEKTVYPVFIDPPVGLGRSEWTKLSSDGDKFWKFSEPEGVGRCGVADEYYCSSRGSYTDRMYFEFGASKLAGKHVLDATFRAYETWSFNCQAHWVDLERTDNISEGTRWPGPKQLDQMGDRYVSAGRGKHCSPEQPNAWVEFNDNPDEKDENLASTVRSLASGKISRLTLMLRAKDESEPRAWKRFDNNAELKVWYMHKPGVPSSVGAVPGTGNGKTQCRPAKDPVTVTVDTPTLRATVQTKVEQHQGEEEGSLQAEFVMQRSGTDTTAGSWSDVWKDYKPDSGWDPDGTRETITTTKRADGGLYRFRARTQSHWVYGGKKGDLFSPYSKWCYLRIDSTAPKEPTITSLLPYKECTTNDCDPRGNPGQRGMFHFRPNTADKDVRKYRWRLLTSDADATKTVEASAGGQAVINLKPGLSGHQTLSVEASDLKEDKEGRVRWGPPAEFVFKVGLAPGASGRWRFDDGGPGSGRTTANDTGEAGTRHDVILRDEAGTGWSTMGRRGAGDYSLRLNDNQRDPDKQVGYASTEGVPVNTQSSFTVSAWAYLTNASANRTVLSAPGEHGSAFTLYYSSTLKKWVFNRTDQDKDGPVYIRSTADTEDPPLRVWTHLVGVFDNQDDADKDNDTLQLFVNGRPQGKPVVLADEASTYTPWTADRNMMVGRAKAGGSYGDYFLGRIDEIATWQRPLQPEEIREENRLERRGVPTNELVAHWDATISSGREVTESPEDPDDPSSTAFPYRRGALDLSSSGARLTGDDATALVLDGKSGYASATGPVVDETGSFTVSARVRLTKSELAGKPVGYRGLVAGQPTPEGKESSWALWVERTGADTYHWKFGRTAVNSSGKVTSSAVVEADEPIQHEEWDTWVDVTGVFDGGLDFTDEEGDQRFGVAQLYVGHFAQQGEEDAGLGRAEQGNGALAVGRGSAKGSTGHYLPGDLAKLRVWSGAMTKKQVTDQIAEPST
ncbi:hypothetical protein GCM10018785_47190 [Streptomyces longispororuber]|uniref:LamG-like jellyroll fold domain-containing protein n=1 Tax=Streptomyces longispororuber TaxID=68230 RepID=A0A918ZWE5_9ACTN|nr:LamG domain-containing protein [Streptomyces longispororuber]GHE73630.1 hypothetical protein GCM10018785_47190 [Streptomyces longispororuber]